MFITVHTCVYVYSSIWWKAVKELATAGQRYPTLRLGLSLGHLGVNPPQWLTMGGINMYEPSPNSSFMTLGLPHRHNLISSNHSRRVSNPCWEDINTCYSEVQGVWCGFFSHFVSATCWPFTRALAVQTQAAIDLGVVTKQGETAVSGKPTGLLSPTLRFQ